MPCPSCCAASFSMPCSLPATPATCRTIRPTPISPSAGKVRTPGLPHRPRVERSEEQPSYVGVVRPVGLRRALAAIQPELDEAYFQSYAPPHYVGMPPAQRAGQSLAELTRRFEARQGGESGLRFHVNSTWLKTHVPGLAPSVECAGPFDPLATFQLLHFEAPFVPVTSRNGAAPLPITCGLTRAPIARTLPRLPPQRRRAVG